MILQADDATAASMGIHSSPHGADGFHDRAPDPAVHDSVGLMMSLVDVELRDEIHDARLERRHEITHADLAPAYVYKGVNHEHAGARSACVIS